MVNDFILIEFGKRIRQLRIDKGLSQEELSFETGFHRTYIGMIERGERNISLTNIVVFAKVFNLTVAEILSLRNDLKLKEKYQLKTQE
ncbi:MAG: helix-turn-helix transcriptional regulator [Bacteroidia bacterium]